MLRNKEIKALMSKQERNLILQSSICDKNKKLKEVLGLFNGRIDKKELPKILKIDSDVYRLLKTSDAVKEISNQASLEWIPELPLGKIDIPCELCGCTKSEDKFVIVNRINHNRLKVGSRCIGKFEKMDNKWHGIPITQVTKLSNENPEKLKRIVYFNEIYKGGKSILTEWKNNYDSFNIEFPKDYDDEFNNIMKKSRRMYTDYINGKIDNGEIKRFAAYQTDFDYFYKKCMSYYDENRNDKYVCTKKIATFLEEKNLKWVLTRIKESGKIKNAYTKYIYHVDFIERFKSEIQDSFSKSHINLVDINNQFISFSFKYERFQPIILRNSLKNFTYGFTSIFYGYNDIKQQEIINGLNIYDSYDNIEEFLGILEYILKGTGYYFKFDDELYKKQKIELYRTGLDRFAPLDVLYFLVNYKKVLFLNKEESKKMLLDDIDRINNWTKISDKKKYDIGDISKAPGQDRD